MQERLPSDRVTQQFQEQNPNNGGGTELSGYAALTQSTVLPEGWCLTKLGEIAEWGSGGTPSRKNSSFYGGNVPWVKTGDLGAKILNETSEFITEEAVAKSSAKLFLKGSVAIAMYGATIGKTSILGIDATTNQACGVGHPITQLTTTEFLYYFLCNEKDNFIAKGKGGAQPNISQGLIKEHEVALPPLAEQQQIATKLDELLAQVDILKTRLDTIPKILKRFRQSVLAAAVSGKLTEDWRRENEYDSVTNISEKCFEERKLVLKKAKKPIKLEEVPELGLPITWGWISIDEVCLKITDGTHHSPKSFPSGDKMYVTSKNVREGYIDLSKITFVDQKTHSEIYSRCDVVKGDVLYVKDGANTGLACVNNIADEVSLLSSVAVMRPNKLIIAKYLEHYLNSPIGRRLIPYLTHTINIHLKTIRCALKNLRVALRLEK